MAVLSETFLRDSARDFRFDYNMKSLRSSAEMSVFLSHSHADRELALGLQRLLASRGLSLYLDWQDAEMPPSPNRDTAERIKARIGLSDFFLLLATSNAMNSRWVPWEIGVADSRKASDHIIVVPVRDSSGRYHGNEYLQLYSRLEAADNGSPAIFEPNKNTGYFVEHFMRQIVTR